MGFALGFLPWVLYWALIGNVPFPVARTGARLTQALPRAPLSADQVTMLEAGDNVVTDDDAARVFDLPLVALDEQIRRVA